VKTTAGARVFTGNTGGLLTSPFADKLFTVKIDGLPADTKLCANSLGAFAIF